MSAIFVLLRVGKRTPRSWVDSIVLITSSVDGRSFPEMEITPQVLEVEVYSTNREQEDGKDHVMWVATGQGLRFPY